MNHDPSRSGWVTLRLMVLEDRSVPSATASTVLDPRTAAALTPNHSTLDPQPVQVGTNEQGQAIYTVTVQPTVCNCAACRAARAAAAAAAAVVSPPAVVAPPVPSPTQTAPSSPPSAPTPTSTPAAHTPDHPSSVAPVKAFVPDATTDPASPAPVVVARTDSGYSLLARSDVKAASQPDVVSTPAPAAVSVAPFIGAEGPLGGKDQVADPIGLDQSV